jgi:hypothetical protein
MNSSVFCDVTPCGMVKTNRHFGRTWRLYIPPKLRLTFTRLQAVTFYVVKHGTRHSHGCENQRSNKMTLLHGTIIDIHTYHVKTTEHYKFLM